MVDLKNSTWRARARKIILDTLAASQGLSADQIRAALFDAYPFGERKYYPYKVWLDEIRRQRSKKQVRETFATGSLFDDLP